MDTSLIISPYTHIVCADCDHLTAQEDFYHADRVLDMYVCDYVEKGSIYVTEDGTDHAVDAGQMIILEKGLRHFGKRLIEKGTSWYYIHFYVYETYDVSESGIHLPKVTTPPDDIKDHLDRLILTFRKEGVSPESNTELMRFFCALRPDREMSLSDRIAKYLEQHWNERFCASDLERHFYLNSKYMAYVFRREKGTTMQGYHDMIKLGRCAVMLRSTLMSISEISLAAGYSDPLYFSKRFSKHYGMSPTEYRHNIKSLM